jgi:hypothetical protein
MIAKLKALEERFILAETEQERDAITEELGALCDADAVAVANAALINLRRTNDELELRRLSRRDNFMPGRILRQQPHI